MFVSLNAYELIPVKSSYQLKIIEERNLEYTIDGNNLSEISDLVYDANSSRLYMVSDKGILFTFKALFNGRGFNIQPEHSYRLRDRDGTLLKGNRRDSEGLALDDSGNLYISFERITQILNVSKDGRVIREVKLPKGLEQVVESSPNKSLESLAWDKRYGLITALEYPKRGKERISQTIYATNGSEWNLKMEDIKRNGISEIEVMDDGNLLILERAFNWFIGKFEVNLVKLNIKDCQEKLYCPKELLVKMRINNFINMENFEGLAKVGHNKYLLISDDNNNMLALTKLVYFELKPLHTQY